MFVVIGRAVDDDFMKGVIMAFVDPLTRHHTVALHARSRPCAELNKAPIASASVNFNEQQCHERHQSTDGVGPQNRRRRQRLRVTKITRNI